MSEHSDPTESLKHADESVAAQPETDQSASPASNAPPPREVAIARSVGIFVFAIALYFTIDMGMLAGRLNSEYVQLATAHPMDSEIDLTVVGETTVPFNQSYNAPHGQAIRLSYNLQGHTPQSIADRFAEFSGHVRIVDHDGREIKSVDINAETVGVDFDGTLVLATIPSIERGEYDAVIRVDAPVTLPNDAEQVVYCDYWLCGLEMLPRLVAGAISIGSGVVALITSLCVLPGLIRCGIWRAVPTGP